MLGTVQNPSLMRDEPLRWLLASIIKGYYQRSLHSCKGSWLEVHWSSEYEKVSKRVFPRRSKKPFAEENVWRMCHTVSHCASQFGNPGKESRKSRKSRCATFANEKLRLGNQIEIRLKICSELFFDWKIFSLPFSDSPDLVAGSQSSERPAPFVLHTVLQSCHTKFVHSDCAKFLPCS